MIIKLTKRKIAQLFVKILSHDVPGLQNILNRPFVFGPVGRISIGKEVHLQNTILNTSSGSILIGDYTFSGHNVLILTGTHDYLSTDEERYNYPREGRDINIGKGVWIGSGEIMLGNVKISDNSVICAGAVVTKDCVKPGLYGGIPAKLIREISI